MGGKGRPKLKDDKADKGKKQDKGKRKINPVSKAISEGLRGIVRICSTDVFGDKKLISGLTRIKGVGKVLANSVIKKSKLNPNMKIGELEDSQVKTLEEIIKEPLKYGIPKFMINRRIDRETGNAIHVTGPDLIITKRMDLDFLKKIRCYKGIRHERGLPVRGQRTRGSFRGKKTVGVVRKKLKPGKK